ncbi:MAG: hypothetical protein QG564_93 [Campylobacterota bacterium]|nr:hypothetical protein [Campylobacterota bacterium]
MKFLLKLTVVLLVLLMSGCANKPVVYGKVDKTPYETKECHKSLALGLEIIKEKKIDKIVVHKSKRKLYAYKNGKAIYEFRISLGKNGDKGHKVKKGDLRTPEGSYTVVRKKCDSRLYRSLMISYPNKHDEAMAKEHGLSPGGYITIHGQPKWNADGHGDSYTLAYDWTEGCIALSNSAIDVLWYAVERGVPVEIYAQPI